ncbi:MAG: hypothetical protein HC880_08290 [Bacteroidia bacterium]|nr:hypothetical protein [Bacteroidia bacterium]
MSTFNYLSNRLSQGILLLGLGITLLYISSCKEDDDPQPPVIESVQPDSARAGSMITITGSKFQPAGGNTVRLGSVSITPTSATATSLVLTFRMTIAAGNYTLTVTNTQNLVSAGTSFTVLPPNVPSITNLNPTEGTFGDTITITGTNLSTVQSVRFGSNESSPPLAPPTGNRGSGKGALDKLRPAGSHYIIILNRGLPTYPTMLQQAPTLPLCFLLQ